MDAAGDGHVSGQTCSPDFPVTAGAFQTTNNGSAKDNSNTFISKLSPSGSTRTPVSRQSCRFARVSRLPVCLIPGQQQLCVFDSKQSPYRVTNREHPEHWL